MSLTILRAAERLFAEASYESVSQRQVAKEAQVDQALINYYFESKQGLYTAVVKRHGAEIVEQWKCSLQEFDKRGQTVSVEDILRAYIGPFFEYRKQPDLHVLKVLSRLHAETDPMFLSIRREIFDETSQEFIRRLRVAIPDCSAADIAWRFVFAIGAFLFVGPGVDRLDDLSDGAYRIDDPEEVVHRLISFFVGGFTAPSTPQPARDTGGPKINHVCSVL